MLCCLLNISRSFGRIYCYLMHRLSVQRRVVLIRSVGNYTECLCRSTEYRQILQYIQSLCNKDFVHSRARSPDGMSWTFSRNGVTKSSLALQTYYLMDGTVILTQASLIFFTFSIDVPPCILRAGENLQKSENEYEIQMPAQRHAGIVRLLYKCEGRLRWRDSLLKQHFRKLK